MSLRRKLYVFLLRNFPSRASEAVLANLLRETEQALRGGVVLTKSEWDSLGSLEQSAFVTVNEKLQAERAAQAGLATLSLDTAAEVASVADGGAAKRAVRTARDQAEVRRSLEAAVNKLHKPMIDAAG